MLSTVSVDNSVQKSKIKPATREILCAELNLINFWANQYWYKNHKVKGFWRFEQK